MKRLTPLLLLLLPALPLGAQDPSDAVVKGEFPGLQLLPPGSEVKGISLPRYEKHRISTLIRAAKLIVLSRKEVELKDIEVSLYGEDGAVTRIATPGATYDFTTLRAATQGTVKLEDPRFSAEGKGVVYRTELRRGIITGPVRTTLSASVLHPEPKKKP